MTCDFKSFSTLLQSYQGDRKLIMKGSAKWNPILTEKYSQNWAQTANLANQHFTHWATKVNWSDIVWEKWTKILTAQSPYTPNFSISYPVICKVYTKYHGTSETEHGLSISTVYNKYLSWLYGVDRKICHEGHWSASRGLPSDAEQWSQVTDFSIHTKHPW